MNIVKVFSVGILLVSSFEVASGQEEEAPAWQFAPSLLYVDYFHSAKIEGPQGTPAYDFSGEGITIQFRSFYRDLEPLSFTMSAGVIWFTNSGYGVVGSPVVPMATANGIGSVLSYKDFTDFPLALGIDAVVPKTQSHDIMAYIGGSMVTNFIDGDIDPDQQIKIGYKIGGGISVKMFEFSVHYVTFSDIKNIGASIGLRLNSFSVH